MARTRSVKGADTERTRRRDRATIQVIRARVTTAEAAQKLSAWRDRWGSDPSIYARMQSGLDGFIAQTSTSLTAPRLAPSRLIARRAETV
jgi:hypothetical protein